MLSPTIAQLENFNKVLNVRIFLEEMSKAFDINMSKHDMNLLILESTVKASPTASEAKKRDFIKHKEQYLQAYLKEFSEKTLEQGFITCYQINSWLEFKEIYKFDKDALDLLAKDPFKDMTYEELAALKMPYSNFAIENEIECFENDIAETTLVERKISEKDGAVIFSFISFIKNSNVQYLESLSLLPGQTVKSIIDSRVNKTNRDYLETLLKLILYISQPKIQVLKKAVSRGQKQGKVPKSFYNLDYKENEVAYQLGNAIRKYKYVYEHSKGSGEPTGRTVRPHQRCGHFHHYWVGVGRTELIVKYVEPTFVLGGSNKATVHKVGKE